MTSYIVIVPSCAITESYCDLKVPNCAIIISYYFTTVSYCVITVT